MEQTQATENLSQWFSLDEQKPWEPGVYEVACKYGSGRNYFSYWCGVGFHGGWGSVERAIENKNKSIEPAYQKWRGLASDPNAKPKARGNRKVTRWLHFTGMLGSDLIHKIHGVYKTKKEAEIARDKRNSHGWRSAIQKIRFRTPEAS